MCQYSPIFEFKKAYKRIYLLRSRTSTLKDDYVCAKVLSLHNRICDDYIRLFFMFEFL